MKTILILTDFSPNAANAASQAVRLASKLRANILLAHSYAFVAVGEYAAVVPIMSNENILIEQRSEEKLKEQAKSLQKQIANLPPADRKPHMQYLQMPLDLGNFVKQLCREHDIELIVLGESQDSRAEHFFFGSNTRQIIEHAQHPILLIPEKVGLNKLSKIVFASDFSDHDLLCLKTLTGWAKNFGSEIIVTHVTAHDQDTATNKATEADFVSKIKRLRYPSISYHHIGGQDVAARLRSFCKTAHADILVIGHHHYGFFERIAHCSLTNESIKVQQLPLLVFPKSFKENFKQSV